MIGKTVQVETTLTRGADGTPRLRYRILPGDLP